MRYRGWIMLTLAAALAVACGKQDAPTGPDQAVTVAEFNFMNGPEAPGAVYRETGTFHFYFVVWDYERQLWAEVTNDQDNSWCQSAAGQLPLDIQYAGDWNIIARGEDWYTRVWDTRGRDGEHFCDWIATHDPIAGGNVAFGYQAVGNKEEFKGNGQIDRTDGLGKTHLIAELSWEWDKNTGEWVGLKSAKAHLGPDPRD